MLYITKNNYKILYDEGVTERHSAFMANVSGL